VRVGESRFFNVLQAAEAAKERREVQLCNIGWNNKKKKISRLAGFFPRPITGGSLANQHLLPFFLPPIAALFFYQEGRGNGSSRSADLVQKICSVLLLLDGRQIPEYGWGKAKGIAHLSSSAAGQPPPASAGIQVDEKDGEGRSLE
jgi:hypothetical protein